MCRKKLYSVWYTMNSRCYRKNCIAYKNYGARGITICEKWKSNFDNFYNWAINNGYSENLSIDRIDNNKGYSPENCRWVDRKVQANNQRSNCLITYNGKTQTMKQWAEELGINYSSLRSRLNTYVARIPTEKDYFITRRGGFVQMSAVIAWKEIVLPELKESK